MNQPKDERQEILEVFSRSLRQSDSEAGYSAEELARVFDLAHDIDDSYLQSEALARGQRQYPQNRDLLVRRVLYYLETDESMAGRLLEDHPEIDGTTGELLRLAFVDSYEFIEQSKVVVEKATVITDFDVEVLFTAARCSGAPLTPTFMLEKLRDKLEFLPGFLYKAAYTLESESCYSSAVPFLEELVTLLPFEASYWRMLAIAQSASGHDEKALQALDYDLALVPDSPDALLVKSRVLHQLGRTDESLRIIEQIYEKSLHTADIANLLLAGYNEQNMRRQYKNLVKEAQAEFPDDLQLLMHYLLNFKTDTGHRIRRFMSEGEKPAAYQATEIARSLLNSGCYKACVEWINAYERNNYDSIDDISLKVLALYHLGEYERVCDEFAEKLEMLSEIRNHIASTFSLTVAAAQIRLGRYLDAMKLGVTIVKIINDHRPDDFHSNPLYYRGLINTVGMILSIAEDHIDEEGNQVDDTPTDFDPLDIDINLFGGD